MTKLLYKENGYYKSISDEITSLNKNLKQALFILNSAHIPGDFYSSKISSAKNSIGSLSNKCNELINKMSDENNNYNLLFDNLEDVEKRIKYTTIKERISLFK